MVAALGLRSDSSARVWDVKTRETRRVFRGAGKPFTCLAFSPDERLLALGSDDNSVTLWDVTTGAEFATYRGHQGGVRAVAFRPDGKHLVSLDGERFVRTWDATRSPERRTFRTRTAFHAAVSRDGRLLVAVGGPLERRSAASPSHFLAQVVAARAVVPTGTAAGPTALLLGAAGVAGLDQFTLDSATTVWDMADGRRLAQFTAFAEAAYAVTLSPDGRRVAAAVTIGATEGMVRVWDVGTGKLVHNLADQGPAALGPAHLVAQAFGAQALAPAGGSWGTLTHSLATLPVLKLDAFNVPAAPNDAVAWSPDGKWIASGGQDRVVRLWDAATGRLVRTLSGHGRTVSAVAFSRDGKRLASASGGIHRHYPQLARGKALPWMKDKFDDGPKDVPDLKVWEVATGKELCSLRLPGKGPGLAISPDGETVAATFGDTGLSFHSIITLSPNRGRINITALAARRGDVVRLYRVATGKEVAVLKGHTRPPWSVAFSPDGLRVVTGGGADETIKLWDAKTGEEIMTVGRHPTIVTSVNFSPDGRQIHSTGWDGDVRVWGATPPQLTPRR